MIGIRGVRTGISGGASGRYLWRGLASSLVAAGLIAGLIAGCTWMPDAVNPVEWYKSGRDTVTGDGPSDEKKQAMAKAKATPGQGKAFPNLSTVPDRPRTTSAADRAKLAGGLVADRQHARYTDDVVRGRTPNRPAAKMAPKPAPSVNPAMSSRAVPALPPRAAAAPAPRSMPVRAAPPPRQMTAVAPPPSPRMTPSQPARTARTGKPLPPMVFGPPPTDIAIAQATPAPARAQAPGSLATDSSRTLRAPAFRRQAAARAGQVAVVHFPVGSTRLGPAARRKLRKVARMQREWRGAIRVVGHASSRTGDMDLAKHNLVNFRISLDRANSVARELMRLGVEPRVLRVGANSDSDPVFFEVMPAGESGNRRVEIYFEGRG
jgi:outer membrane protein OmpA-like peptidoglycan-associated protein